MPCTFDSMAIKIAGDVLSCVKNSQNNQDRVEFSLPEDIHDDLLYQCKYVYLDCILTVNRDLLLPRPYLIDDAYLTGDDNINIDIFINSSAEPECYQDLYFELMETIRHEIQHARQYIEPELPSPHGKKGKYYKPKGIRYYLTENELDAQIAGFKLQAKKSGKPFDELVRNYYTNKLDLLPITKKDITKLIRALHQYGKLNGVL